MLMHHDIDDRKSVKGMTEEKMKMKQKKKYKNKNPLN